MMKRASDTETAEAGVTGVAFIPHSSQSICCIPIDGPLGLPPQGSDRYPLRTHDRCHCFRSTDTGKDYGQVNDGNATRTARGRSGNLNDHP